MKVIHFFCKIACENTDPTRIYYVVASIGNTMIADKIGKQVYDAS